MSKWSHATAMPPRPFLKCTFWRYKSQNGTYGLGKRSWKSLTQGEAHNMGPLDRCVYSEVFRDNWKSSPSPASARPTREEEWGAITCRNRKKRERRYDSPQKYSVSEITWERTRHRKEGHLQQAQQRSPKSETICNLTQHRWQAACTADLGAGEQGSDPRRGLHYLLIKQGLPYK